MEVRESETVVERGHRRLSWRIRYRDAWVRVVEWPDAQTTSLDSGPGTVWERSVELSAPQGTELERIVSLPAAARRRSPLEYLERGAGAARAVQRTTFRVGPRGRLLPTRKGAQNS